MEKNKRMYISPGSWFSLEYPGQVDGQLPYFGLSG